MPQGFGHTVFIDRRCDVIRRRFDVILRVGYRDADAGLHQHRDIVLPIAKGHGFRPGNAQALQNGFDCGRLIVTGAVNIIALRITPGKGQLRELIGNRFEDVYKRQVL